MITYMYFRPNIVERGYLLRHSARMHTHNVYNADDRTPWYPGRNTLKLEQTGTYQVHSYSSCMLGHERTTRSQTPSTT